MGYLTTRAVGFASSSPLSRECLVGLRKWEKKQHVPRRYTRDHENELGLSEWKWNKSASLVGDGSMNSNDGSAASVVSTERIYILPVARSSNVDLLRVPHMAAHIFCLHAGWYEGKSLRRHFGDDICRNCGNTPSWSFPSFGGRLGYARLALAACCFPAPLPSHLLNSDETTLTHKSSFVGPQLN